jgi:hypothetical protein
MRSSPPHTITLRITIIMRSEGPWERSQCEIESEGEFGFPSFLWTWLYSEDWVAKRVCWQNETHFHVCKPQWNVLCSATPRSCWIELLRESVVGRHLSDAGWTVARDGSVVGSEKSWPREGKEKCQCYMTCPCYWREYRSNTDGAGLEEKDLVYWSRLTIEVTHGSKSHVPALFAELKNGK